MSDDLSIKKEQINNIENGKGVQHILEKAYKILGNPILSHDMDYKAIALTENIVTDDPIWNDFAASGTFGYNSLVFFKDESFFEMTANAKKITFLPSDKLKYERIFGKLFTADNIQVGSACLLACDKPFEDGDPELFEAVCEVLNRELCASEFYQNYGQAYMETLVSQLIEESIEDKGLYVAHIESIYTGLKSKIRLAVVDVSRCDPANSKLAYFRDLFKQMRPDFKYAIYSKHIIIFISSNHTTVHVEDINKYYKHFEQNDIYAGISDSFENIFDLPIYYKQAVRALNHGLKSNDDQQRFFLFEDIPISD